MMRISLFQGGSNINNANYHWHKTSQWLLVFGSWTRKLCLCQISTKFSTKLEQLELEARLQLVSSISVINWRIRFRAVFLLVDRTAFTSTVCIDTLCKIQWSGGGHGCHGGLRKWRHFLKWGSGIVPYNESNHTNYSYHRHKWRCNHGFVNFLLSYSIPSPKVGDRKKNNIDE